MTQSIKKYFNPKSSVSFKTHITQITVFCFFAILITSSIALTPAYSAIGNCNTNFSIRVGPDYNGPIFLDAYWTDNSALDGIVLDPEKIEVTPGEGPAILAVVLSNRGLSEIYSIQGFLKLPTGFIAGAVSGLPGYHNYLLGSATSASQQTNHAVASFYEKVQPGDAFTMYFPIYIEDNSVVDAYKASLLLEYTIPNHLKPCLSGQLEVPFVLPGKVILDVTSDVPHLEPKVANTVDFVISNIGSSDATGVTATILNIGSSENSADSNSSPSIINLGSNIFDVGTIPLNSNVTISTVLFPDDSASSTIQNIEILMNYGNSYGYKQDVSLATGLIILPNPSESSLVVSLTSNDTTSLINAGSVEDLKFSLKNIGDSPISNILLNLDGESDDLKIIGNSKWSFDNLNPGKTIDVSSQIFADSGMINKPAYFVIDTEYILDGDLKTDSTNLGVYVSGNVDLDLYDLGISKVGTELQVSGSILNKGSSTGLFSYVELVSFPQSNRQVGQQEDPMNDDSAPMKGSLALTDEGSTPMRDGLRPDSGADEEIAQSFENRIRNMQTNSNLPIPQYLGDLIDGSTMPFSISLPDTSYTTGTYPFTFKITYADDLKIYHELVVEKNIIFDESAAVSGQLSEKSRGGTTDVISTDLIAMIGIGVAIPVASVMTIVMIKKKKTTNLSPETSDDDLDFLLDDSTANNNEKKSKS